MLMTFPIKANISVGTKSERLMSPAQLSKFHLKIPDLKLVNAYLLTECLKHKIISTYLVEEGII